MKDVSCIVVLLCLCATAFAQTGPGGVGNSSTNKIWLDASYLTGLNTGENIGMWFDRSGNDWHAVQNNSANRPTYITEYLNGKPVVHFSRTNAPQFLQITNQGVGEVMSNRQTIFTVSKANTVGAGGNDQGLYQIIFSTGGGYISGLYYTGYPSVIKNVAITWLGGNGSLPTRYVSSSALVGLNTWHISTQLVNETSTSTNLKGYVNGFLHGNSSPSMLIADYSAIDKITMGAYAASGYMAALNGDIAEAILFNTTLNDAQRIIVENYLAAKYNLTISNDYYTGHDPSYTLDVQGIGTTNGSTQKHSHAGNSRGLLLTELNSSLNAANEFLFVGHATDDNSWKIEPILNGYSRWDRAWYLRKNANIDVKLSFDFRQAGLYAEGNLNEDISKYRLLYQQTPASAFSIVEVGGQELIPTLDEDRLAFNLTNSQFQNGYYTVGYGASILWTGTVDQRWNNPANWNLNRVPTQNDFVYVNACNICPKLENSTSIKGLRLLSNSKLGLENYVLVVSGAAYFNEAEVQSTNGKVVATDFAELKNSKFKGAITLEKTGDSANISYGGNTFSDELKLINAGSSLWNMGKQASNVINK